MVVVGDVFDTGLNIQETVELLMQVNAVGVWGNHDLGLSHEPDPEVTAGYSPAVRAFFRAFRPTYELEGVLFCHGLPTWNPTDPTIYYLGAKPWTPGSLPPVFTACPQRLIVVGHFHRWLLATPAGQVAWSGEQALRLNSAERYFLVAHAVLDGWCAILDTQSQELQPLRISGD